MHQTIAGAGQIDSEPPALSRLYPGYPTPKPRILSGVRVMSISQSPISFSVLKYLLRTIGLIVCLC